MTLRTYDGIFYSNCYLTISTDIKINKIDKIGNIIRKDLYFIVA